MICMLQLPTALEKIEYLYLSESRFFMGSKLKLYLLLEDTLEQIKGRGRR